LNSQYPVSLYKKQSAHNQSEEAYHRVSLILLRFHEDFRMARS